MLSVIIPTLNESAHIELLLSDLQSQSLKALEVIVVDGGSTDETPAIVKAFSTAQPQLCLRVLTSKKGRGNQLNAGASHASNDWLLFLHADCRLSSDQQLQQSLDQLLQVHHSTQHRVAGHFPLSFETDDDSLKSRLRYFERKSALNRPGTFNGDQGLLIHRESFEQLEGFSTRWGFMEDQDFGARFSTQGEFVTLPGEIRTSARRFAEEGFRERVILNSLIMAMFHLNLTAFFDEAPAIYRSQHNTDRLRLSPFLKLAQQTLFHGSVITVAGKLYALGQYVTGNAWQIALWTGLATPAREEASLQFHDSYVDRIINNPLGYVICVCGVLIWFATVRLRFSS